MLYLFSVWCRCLSGRWGRRSRSSPTTRQTWSGDRTSQPPGGDFIKKNGSGGKIMNIYFRELPNELIKQWSGSLWQMPEFGRKLFSCLVLFLNLQMKIKIRYTASGFRAVFPHSFFADPDPAVFSECGSGSSCFKNADPDPALKFFEINNILKSFL